MVLRIISAFCLLVACFGARVPQKNVTSPQKNVTAPQKNATAPKKVEGKMDLGKLEKMEVSLKAAVSSHHALEGMKELLDEVQHAEAEAKTAKTEEAKSAVMKNISSEITSFKKKLKLRKAELEATAKSDPGQLAEAVDMNITVPKLPSNQESLDNITLLIMKKGNLTKDKAKSLSPIVQQLEGRLDELDYKEKKAAMTQAAFAEREKKVQSLQGHAGEGEAKKSKMLMKFLKRKTKRAYEKKVSEWKAEKKALHDAINAIYVGKVDKLQAAMSRLNEVHAPNKQEFLH